MVNIENLNPVSMLEKIEGLQKSLELLRKQAENNKPDIDWVKINRFCEITGETNDSFKKIRDAGYLAEGKHYKKRPGSNVIYVNLKEWDKWLRTGTG